MELCMSNHVLFGDMLICMDDVRSVAIAASDRIFITYHDGATQLISNSTKAIEDYRAYIERLSRTRPLSHGLLKRVLNAYDGPDSTGAERDTYAIMQEVREFLEVNP
jgi:hypothetical protein